MEKIIVTSEIESRKNALMQAETFASQMGLAKKESLHLRLIVEELLGMVQAVLDTKESKLWIQKDENIYSVFVETNAKIGEVAKEELVNLSTEKKNSAYKGMTGLLLQVFDALINQSVASLQAGNDSVRIGGFSMIDNANVWCYNAIKEQAANEAKRIANWDELEHSVLSKIADDIIVSVRESRAELVAKMKA